MSDLSMFFAQNAAVEVAEEVEVSTRFKDKDGKVGKWKLRSITEDDNQELRKSATKKTKGKNGMYTSDLDTNEYLSKLVVACVVYPDLKNAEIQKTYGVMGAEKLLRKMLLPGEFSALMEKVQAMNGFDQDMNELVEEVKN
ncbi:phage tail assembly chaperone [Paenibacillus macquariensis]|uniref:Phage XkdN-like tail assembly chaperone protein, TAC n=1 Tax=Paenibacillus macquariensis TaxID=948756 RepID=A0ABY1JXF8_9BACL|nr:phage portal protein [Paenibacillus macquariensis]MEC0089329.1 phage portal protein [Paenibacillus macquariensis]OAB33269.1 phage portal protein [Paenibacillus macquariensis subsp. macquariensis]SIQ93718.1 Phage XkdN-like tail assembly chaperone protein, TAC [Paenibacillus macquariensis]